jgi:hypothetical protein
LQTDKCKCQTRAKLRSSIRKTEHGGHEKLYLSNKLLTTQDYTDEDCEHSVFVTSLKS